MAREFSKKFYQSKQWRDTQKAFMIANNYICNRCGGVAEIVHHKIYLTPQNINDVNISLNWNNLECLCATCHQHEHFKDGGATKDGLMFDSNGNLVKIIK